MNNQKYERFLAYFSRDVLNDYSFKPDKYKIEEDDYGGFLYNKNFPSDISENKWYQIRYAFRKLKDETLCIAAFIPDLNKLSEEELTKWGGYLLDEPLFAKDDDAFFTWVGRYLETDWNFKARPLAKFYRQIKLINSISLICFNKAFFKKEINPRLTFPKTENTESYNDAHLELYRLIIAIMMQQTIRKMSQ